MSNEKAAAQPAEGRWSIVLDWFAPNNRSASILIKDYLCASCAKKLGAKKETTPKALLLTIHSCCSQTPEFIHDKLPILESAFRLFLSNGNHPLTLNELSSELGKLRYGDIGRTSPEILFRILKSDQFYGLQEVQN
jgi:hypothetical protein